VVNKTTYRQENLSGARMENYWNIIPLKRPHGQNSHHFYRRSE